MIAHIGLLPVEELAPAIGALVAARAWLALRFRRGGREELQYARDAW